MTALDASKCLKSVEGRALWTVGPGAAALRTEELPPPSLDEARVATVWSAISRGTERLVFQGLTDPVHRDRMRAPLQQGDFPFPVKYGYCAVGRVEAGPAALEGRLVFALAPHQTRFNAPASMLTPLPEGLPPRRATLAANMETALNALWDGGAGPGDRIVVVGAGLVGLLVTYLAARLPGAEVTAIDPDESRAGLARSFGAAFAPSSAGVADADLVFHTSGSGAGLATALACCGEEARVVEMSWYGDKGVNAQLGGAFHHRRLQIVSSQVGMVSPARRPRWSHRRRLEKALALLEDPALDALITDEVAFDDLPQALPRILADGAAGIATVVRYK
ncbi:zinc-dependent alcohol dehydrogenase [Xanthobacter oligotrophicus]|uniref:zinc-dependent alcohol dehydrogenase n=1 Tax=Xanthobacter oligotrophicus TaxID=2607286 RepID=UPI00165DBD55|nr:zinc-binding alcohol dehydrogenase [Xanthobacter oligotrophicus]MCG5234697.1 zinc-binding alcohol dehydrogenase [Xanthobacter oligotrophicus]